MVSSASTGGLFSNTSASASTGSLFSSASGGASTGGLFGNIGAATGGLFSTPAASSGGLFATLAAGSGSGGIFGGDGGLFGNNSGAASSSGGLFGTAAPSNNGASAGKVQEEGDDDRFVVEEEVTCIPGWSASVTLDVRNDISTGEETEQQVYCQRSRLYRFRDGEWKERGTGDAKLLKNPQTGFTRFLHRQDKTMKIVANFYVIDQETYCDLRPNSGSAKCWVWTVPDCSDESEPVVEQFALRFGSEELAAKFKEEFDKVKRKPDANATSSSGADPKAIGATSKAAPPTKPAVETENDEEEEDEEGGEDYDYDESYVWPEKEDCQPGGSAGGGGGGVTSLAALAAQQNASGWKCPGCGLRWPEEAKECAVCEIPRPGCEDAAEKNAEQKAKDMAEKAALFGGGGSSATKSSGFSFPAAAPAGPALIFGQPAAVPPPAKASGGAVLFGASSGGPSPFAGPASGGLFASPGSGGGGLFGGAASSGSGGLFGGGSTSGGGGLFNAPSSGGGLFGGGGASSSATLFGGAPSSGGLFGGGSSGGSLFGGSPSSGGLFGGSASSGGLFDAQASSAPPKSPVTTLQTSPAAGPSSAPPPPPPPPVHPDLGDPRMAAFPPLAAAGAIQPLIPTVAADSSAAMAQLEDKLRREIKRLEDKVRELSENSDRFEARFKRADGRATGIEERAESNAEGLRSKLHQVQTKQHEDGSALAMLKMDQAQNTQVMSRLQEDLRKESVARAAVEEEARSSVDIAERALRASEQARQANLSLEGDIKERLEMLEIKVSKSQMESLRQLSVPDRIMYFQQQRRRVLEDSRSSPRQDSNSASPEPRSGSSSKLQPLFRSVQ